MFINDLNRCLWNWSDAGGVATFALGSRSVTADGLVWTYATLVPSDAVIFLTLKYIFQMLEVQLIVVSLLSDFTLRSITLVPLGLKRSFHTVHINVKHSQELSTDTVSQTWLYISPVFNLQQIKYWNLGIAHYYVKASQTAEAPQHTILEI